MGTWVSDDELTTTFSESNVSVRSEMDIIPQPSWTRSMQRSCIGTYGCDVELEGFFLSLT